MNPISRGLRNVFRNMIRTSSIVIILGLSIGLVLIMLIAQRAVDKKISSVKSSIGNTIMIAPAGFTPGSQANNALTTTQLAAVQKITHVSGLTENLTDRLSTTGSDTASTGRFGGTSSSSSTTSLTSATTLNSANGGSRFMSGGEGGSLPTNFSLPISFVGTTDPASINGSSITINKGAAISGTATSDTALISSAMATKNNLSVGSTFTAYNTALAVSGIFTSSSQAANNSVILSLATLQQLSGQTGVVTSATATVDSLDNLSAVTTAIKSSLGSSADVTSAQEQADSAVAPLNSVKTVTRFSLIGALVAGAVIILLTMIMVVRERKREIGVVKAIGGSNLRIITEFAVESLALAVIGSLIGIVLGVVASQPITKVLVNNSTSSSTSSITSANNNGQGANRGMYGGEGGFSRRVSQNSTLRNVSNVKTEIGWIVPLEGVGAALLISVVGSVLAAGMISKVRPATIMRAD